MNHFFVTGLPRSRTAWLANFLTWQGTFCYHDALSFLSPTDMVMRFKSLTLCDTVGDSDSALTLHMSAITRFFPDANWLFVVREPELASSSYWRRFGSKYPLGPQTESECDRRFMELQERLEQAMEMVSNKMVVKYDRLHLRGTVGTIWEYLVGTPFQEERWKMLETFQVNVIASKVRLAKTICLQS